MSFSLEIMLALMFTMHRENQVVEVVPKLFHSREGNPAILKEKRKVREVRRVCLAADGK